MALSMDEQRVLAEIEKRLVAEEPGLAASLTNFRRPGPAAVLRSPRARIIGSLFTVLLVAMISLMVYAMIPFRGHTPRAPADKPGTFPSQTQISAVGPGSPKTVTRPSDHVSASHGSTSAPAGSSAGSNASTGTRSSTSKAATTPGATSGVPAASSGHTAASGQTQGTKARASTARR